MKLWSHYAYAVELQLLAKCWCIWALCPVVVSSCAVEVLELIYSPRLCQHSKPIEYQQCMCLCFFLCERGRFSGPSLGCSGVGMRDSKTDRRTSVQWDDPM